jgi:hypothetical protein
MTQFPQSGYPANSVDEILADEDSPFGKSIKRARLLMRLESLLSSLLDPDLSAQFQVAAIERDRLSLVSPSASWATRLRMKSPEMLRHLHKSGYTDIQFIVIRVAPLTRKTVDSRPKRSLSPAAELAHELMKQYHDNYQD